MKTDKEMISDLIKRKEAYDAKREAANRRLKIAASALAVVILTASLPVTAFIVSNRRANVPGTEPGSVTAETVLTGVTETEGTEEESKYNDTQKAYESENSGKSSDSDSGGYASAPSTPFQYGVTADFYDKDKQNPIILSNDEYGRKTWLNSDVILRYEIDLDPHIGENHDYGRYEKSFYGYKKTSDIHELEIKLKNTNKWAGDEFLIRIEAPDCVEILSETTVKSVFPTVKNEEWNAYEPGDYVSIPLRFRFTGDEKWLDFKVYLFRRSAGNEYHGAFDHITEAEEYFASGKSMADKAYPGWQELQGQFNPLHNAASNYLTVRFIEIKDYDFVLTTSAVDGTAELYERAALYFGDVDENGVPIFITEPDHPDYRNPCRLPMCSDIPGYDSEYNRRDGNAAR